MLAMAQSRQKRLTGVSTAKPKWEGDERYAQRVDELDDLVTELRTGEAQGAFRGSVGSRRQYDGGESLAGRPAEALVYFSAVTPPALTAAENLDG